MVTVQCLTPPIFGFVMTSNAFLKRLVSLKNWLLRPFSTRKPHAKAVPRKDYFTHLTLKMQERDAEWSAPTIARHIHSASVPLGTTVAQRYDVPWDWLWDACHMARVCWGTRCKGFRSKECPHYHFEQSMRNPLECGQVQRALSKSSRSCLRTSNNQPWFTSLEIPWGYLAQALLHWLSGGLCHARKCQLEDIACKEKVWFTFAQRTFAPETFGKRRKGERKPEVILLTGSCERLASRNPRVLCQKYGGACTTYYLKVPKVQETRREIGFPCSQERREEISK
jgi:hypothetical protein